MSIRLSDRPRVSTGHLLKELGEIYYRRFTQKAVQQLQIWLKSGKNMSTLHEDLRAFIFLTAVRYILQLDNSWQRQPIFHLHGNAKLWSIVVSYT